MKKLKPILTIFLQILFISSFTISCKDDKKDGELPPQAEQFIQTYFSSYNVSNIQNHNNNYEVKLITESVVECTINFDLSGNWEQVRVNSRYALPNAFVQSLPKNMLTYITEYYPNYMGLCNVQKHDYGYEVKLTNMDHGQLKFTYDGVHINHN